jgi:hypothetical protein
MMRNLMFPLAGQSFPTTTDQLVTAIKDALAEVLAFPAGSDVVQAAESTFPDLASLTIDVSGATVDIEQPPPVPQPAGERRPGITVGQLDVTGRPVYYEQGKAELELKASGLRFDFARDAGGDALLVLTDAADGHVRVKIGKDDLRAMLLAAASAAAKSQGVTIQDLDVSVDATGDRSIAADVRVKAKKMFMSGVVTVRGKAAVDDNLVATVSDLACTGEGVVGTMAAGFLQSKLQTHNGKKFPLMTFSLGDVALRDLKISTGDAVELSAEFGRKA